MADFSQVPKDLIKVADYLRSKDSLMKPKPGIFSGRRAFYFKGKHVINALQRDGYQKKFKTAIDEQKAIDLFQKMLESKLFVRVDKGSKKQLVLSSQPGFEADAYYTWIYEGSTLTNTLLGIGVLILVFVGVMFPLWPPQLRQGVYYLSLGALGLLGFFMVLAVVRLVVYIFTRLFMSKGGWLYPNLFADVGVIESFTPAWQWEEKKKRRTENKKDE